MQKELGHVPAQSEVIGGDLLALRFGSWATVLNYSGYVDYKGPALSALPLERTAIFQEEYERLSAQHIKDKEARKKKAKADRREQNPLKSVRRKRLPREVPMSGGARNRFDGQSWIENIIKERT